MSHLSQPLKPTNSSPIHHHGEGHQLCFDDCKCAHAVSKWNCARSHALNRKSNKARQQGGPIGFYT